MALGWSAPHLPHAEPAAERLLRPKRSGPAIDPNLYANAVDTEVTYDDSIAQSYDDGYGPQAFSQFEAALAPFGAWIDDPVVGRVWVPSAAIVGRDFSPYVTNGRWVFTEYGWTWESGWAWGWAPFHYGRWAMLGNGDWAWVPGTLWGPAWVAWRAGHQYVAWAPLPPRGMKLGRPLGPRSPWRLIRAESLGGENPEYVPLRTAPSVFGRTAVVSNVRSMAAGRGSPSIRMNQGPSRRRWRRVPAPPPAPLATVAPHAVPRVTIRARPGASLPSRPWVAAGAREQTRIYRWPTPTGS